MSKLRQLFICVCKCQRSVAVIPEQQSQYKGMEQVLQIKIKTARNEWTRCTGLSLVPSRLKVACVEKRGAVQLAVVYTRVLVQFQCRGVQQPPEARLLQPQCEPFGPRAASGIPSGSARGTGRALAARTGGSSGGLPKHTACLMTMYEVTNDRRHIEFASVKALPEPLADPLGVPNVSLDRGLAR